MQDTKHVKSNQKWMLAGLVLILALATFLRFDGLTWAYSYRLHCDEAKLAHVASDMGEKFPQLHWANPHFTSYGALPMYLALLFTPLVKLLVGPDISNINTVLLAGRIMSALADITSVLLLFFLIQRLASTRAGLWAAALYSVALIGVRESHFYTPDTLGVCMILVFLNLTGKLLSSVTPRDWIIAGAALGLALSVKFSSFPLIIIGLIAWGIQVWMAVKVGGDPKLFRMNNAARNMRLLVAGLFIISVLPLAMWSLARPRIIGYGTTALTEKITEEKLETHTIDFWTSQVESIYRGGQRIFLFVTIMGFGMFVFLMSALAGERGLRLGMEAWIRLPLLGLYLAAIPVTFVLINPYSLIDPVNYWSPSGPLTVTWNLMMVSGSMWPPPSWSMRFEGTLPVIYQLLNIMPWALGLPLMLLLVAGAVWACVIMVRKGPQAYWPVILATAIFLLLLVGMHVKPVRYLMPLAAILCAVTALGLEQVFFKSSRRLALTGNILAGSVVVLSAVWCYGYLNIYHEPDNRVAAVQWLSANVKSGAHVVFEKDDALGAAGEDALETAGNFVLERFEPFKYMYDLMGKELTTDDLAKSEKYINDTFATTDVFILTDTNIRQVMLMKKVFPTAASFYEALAAGNTPFELVANYDNGPMLFGWRIPEDAVETSFTLFDHPKVMIYQRKAIPGT